MKTIKTYILLFATGLLLMSCSQYTDGINVNPNAFTSAPGNLLVGQAQLQAIQLSSSNSSRFTGMFTDQFTGSDRQYITVNNYDVTANDFSDEWSDTYVFGAQQARLAQLSGIESDDKLLVGVAQIMEAILIGESAALWGDIPYSEAFDESILNPSYDTQQSVLSAVQSVLDLAITNLNEATVANVYNNGVFVANSATWSQVAHSLKARYYLISKDYAQALTEAQQGISNASGDLLSSHSSASGARNLYFQFVKEQREGYLTANGSNLYKLLSGDRARLLATPGDSNRLGFYFYADPDSGNDELNYTDGGYFAVDASFPIVSWVETKLIEAEAAQRTNGDALTPFNEVRDYLEATYGGGFPHSASAGDDLLKEILEEKYISLPGSMQVFHDVRRTNNVLNVPIKGTGNTTIPQRFYYPQDEINANTNFPGLVDLFTPTPVNQ